MTENPRTVRDTDAASEAIDALYSMEVRHLPVLDSEDNLVGMLSDRDLAPLMRRDIEAVDAQAPALPSSQRRVVELMSADVVSVNLEASLPEIIDALIEHRIGAVPVVDADGALVGIISYVDVLRAMKGAMEEGEA